MRRGDHLRQRQQRVLARRFLLEDVDRRAGNPTIAQGIAKRRFVDDPAPRDIDQANPRLGQSQRPGIDQVMRFARERHMQGDEISLRHQLLEGNQFDVELGSTLLGQHRIRRDNAHAEGLGAMGNFTTDAPQADHAEHFVPKFGPQKTRSFPAARLDGLVCLGDVACQGQHHRQRVLGGRDRVPRGGVDDQDASPGSRLDIDVVHARAGTPDDLETATRLDHPGIDPGLAADDERVVLGDAGDQRGRALLQFDVDLGVLSQPDDPRFRELCLVES